MNFYLDNIHLEWQVNEAVVTHKCEKTRTITNFSINNEAFNQFNSESKFSYYLIEQCLTVSNLARISLISLPKNIFLWLQMSVFFTWICLFINTICIVFIYSSIFFRTFVASVKDSSTILYAFLTENLWRLLNTWKLNRMYKFCFLSFCDDYLNEISWGNYTYWDTMSILGLRKLKHLHVDVVIHFTRSP